MMNIYTRQAATFRNEMRQQCGALLGIVQGILADHTINDQEVEFLHRWLIGAENVRLTWPGDVIYAQVESALADGAISTEERAHLVSTLSRLIGGTLDELAESTHVTGLAFDEVSAIEVAERRFCLTGDFAYGTRDLCQRAIEQRGGVVQSAITKKLHHLVVGGLGSTEWKHGAFGTKIQKAIQYKRAGAPILIVHEEVWAASMFS